MRLRRYMFAFPLSAAAGLLIAGCPDDNSIVHPTPGPDATVTPDSSVKPDSGPDQKALVRLANLIPGTPAIDICIKSADAGDAGADAGDTADAGDAGDSSGYLLPPILQFFQIKDGIKYKDVTKYIDITQALSLLPTGKIKAKVVSGAGEDCSGPALGQELELAGLPLKPGSQVTLALVPTAAGPTVKVVADPAKLDSAKATVRFLNASTQTLDFGTGTGASFAPSATLPPAGDNTPAPVAPFQNTTFSFRVSNATGFVSVANASAAAGSLTSVIAVGAPAASELLFCRDSAAPVGDLTDCSPPVPADAGSDAGNDAGDAGDGGP